MKPYKLKHVPTELYYQPYKYRGSNLSERGKIYQTKRHGLSNAFNLQKKYPDNEHHKLFCVFVQKDSKIHKLLSDWNWIECYSSIEQIKAFTKLEDWIIEEI